MPDQASADELDLQSIIDQDDPANDTDVLDVDAVTPDPTEDNQVASVATQSDDGVQENWTPEQKAVYTKATQKYSAEVAATKAEAAAAAAAATAAQSQIEFLRNQLERASTPAPAKQADPEDESPEMTSRLDALFKKTPTYKAMQAGLQNAEATARSAMAATPEAFIPDGEIDKETLAEITPELRRIASQQRNLDPNTIKLIASSLATPRLTARLQAFKSAVAKARQTKKAALQKASTPSSGGLESSVKDFESMTDIEKEAFFEREFARFDKQPAE